jgi:hypothetical protein
MVLVPISSSAKTETMEYEIMALKIETEIHICRKHLKHSFMNLRRKT